MKELKKYGFIVYFISELGLILIFLISRTDWFQVTSLVEKAIAIIMALGLTIGIAYYSWLKWQPNK